MIDKIQIKLYLSSSLYQIAPHIGLKKLSQIPDELEKIVQELNQKNYDKLEFEYFDPSADEELAAVVKKYKIMNVKWPALAKGTVAPGEGAIGLVTEFGERALVVPLLQVIQIPIIGTQYKLLTAGEMQELINKNIEALIDINEELGATIIMVEHDMNLVTNASNRVMAMVDGSVVAIGTPTEIKNHPEVLRAYLGD